MARIARRRAEEREFLEDPERRGIPTRGVRVDDGSTTMFEKLFSAVPDEVRGFVAIQLLVPVSVDEPRAMRERG